MMLKTLMEDKQLDFNRPFRSVRRLPIAPRASPECNDDTKPENPIPRIPSLPAYKSEMNSGPIRNPGTVPFLWEQSPGRPKNESKSQTRPPVAPKLPPGRILTIQQQNSDKGSPKRDSAKPEPENENSDDDYGSEAYVDARDTLSRTESSVLNCSVSGLSGLDGPDVKPFGAFYDPQARDFMMGRFLPAAKAMASESPHYSARKQPVARELPPRRVNKVTTVENQKSVYQPYTEGVEHEESEESEDEPENPSSRVCGLIPQFCLLSPVPGLRVQGHAPVSSAPRAQAMPPKQPDGSALYKRLQGNARHEITLHEEKTRKNLREILACKSNEWEIEWEIESSCPVIEKTLYIDSVHLAKPDFEVLENDIVKEESCFVDSSQPKSVYNADDFRQSQDLFQNHITSTSSKSSEDVRTDTTKLNPPERNDHSLQQSSYMTLQPPLPKSPSESWLSRALNTASSRNHRSSPALHSYNRTQPSKSPSLDPKWETIVKTSNAHNERLRFSEELLAPIPEA